MKKLLFILLMMPLFIKAQNTTPTIGQVFNTIADLKLQKGNANAVVYVIGGTTTEDFRGAFYKWDNSSVASEDMTNYNVIQVTGLNTGRWMRTNQTSQALPQGTLFRLGPLKILSASGVTNASGEFVLNATLDNTAGGTAIFSSILFNTTSATVGSSSPNDAVNGTIKTTTAKVITYRYTKGSVIGLLGALSISAAGSNVPVQCFVIGL